MNELATRHQNYGSLFYNQEGFTGNLGTMPTPSNLPRMSPEDEALMWDIMDLTSASFSDLSGFDDLVPSQKESTTKAIRSAGEPSGTDANAQGHTNASGTASFPSQETSIFAGAPQQGEEDPSSQWPFSQRVGQTPLVGVPDIPDWMIFGDFTEHL